MEDRGVTPVVSVILMVAIVVVLAAVVSVAALGIGDSISEPAPSVVFQTEDIDENSVVLRHAGGETLAVENLAVRGGEINDEETPALVQTGDAIIIDPESAVQEVVLVFESGQTSTILTRVSMEAIGSLLVNGETTTAESLEGTTISGGESATITNNGDDCVRVTAEDMNTQSISPLFGGVEFDIEPGEERSIDPTSDVEITDVGEC